MNIWFLSESLKKQKHHGVEEHGKSKREKKIDVKHNAATSFIIGVRILLCVQNPSSSLIFKIKLTCLNCKNKLTRTKERIVAVEKKILMNENDRKEVLKSILNNEILDLMLNISKLCNLLITKCFL